MSGGARLLALAAASALLFACGRLTSGGIRKDGGLGTDGGGGPGDSGNAGAPTLTWQQLPGPSPVPTSFYTVGGTPAGAGPLQLYVGGETQLGIYDGGSWNFPIYSQPSNFTLSAVWVSDAGAVYGAGDQFLLYCPGNCTSPGAFTTQNVPETMQGLCTADGTTVFASGYPLSSPGVLYRFDPVQLTWKYVFQNTQTQQNAGCWVDPNGVVYIATYAAVARYDSNGGGITTESLNSFPPGFPVGDQTQTALLAVWGYGSTVFAAGNSRLIFQRNAAGSWDWAFHDPNLTVGLSSFTAMTGSGDAAYAVGDYAAPWNVAHYTANDGWAIDNSPAASALLNVQVFSLWARSPNEYYAVGAANGGGAMLLSGTP
jgi:hypothetical protein